MSFVLVMIETIFLLELVLSHCYTTQVYLKVQKGIQLILNDWEGLHQLLCAHGAHHPINPAEQ